ncbi:cobyrinate a,c-diamide synthase [Cohaesibacter intestini]|uniref:cobyrinate a,c-diamide synthase n=1 Tax=Cohaesibacter intestini TaxID=2211145 RepID=UPI00315DB9B0
MRPMTGTPGLILAASSSNSGKTTLSLGLQRLFIRKGLKVAPAKTGPDYIDPAFHAVASGRPSINLDPWAMAPEALRTRSHKQAKGFDMLFVEGVMGLFDGAANGQGSTASLARILNLPVILVLDVKGQAQTAAAIANGIKMHDPNVTIGGVILNRVGSEIHEGMLRDSFDKIGIPVVGAVRVSDDLSLPSRHLGLVQASEHHELSNKIDRIADHVGQYVDLDHMLSIAETGALANEHASAGPDHMLAPLGRHIAIAKDAAFTFIYPHLISEWREQGAEISFFSPLADEIPNPEADAIYLPGGYPELYLEQLDAASHFKASMKAAAKANILIFGECGGYMVLGREITSKEGVAFPMLDLLPISTSFNKPKLKLGYRKLSHKSNLPWPQDLNAHEFHFSQITWMGEAEPLFDAKAATGRDVGAMGQKVGSVHGSFAHIIAPSYADS